VIAGRRACHLLLAIMPMATACTSTSSDFDTAYDRFAQPFSFSYAYADEHVIAFLTGHPEFEAVEALIERRERDRR
jgi:hypothetical protein